MNKTVLGLLFSSFLSASASFAVDIPAGFIDLFPGEGVPQGWLVRKWDNLKNPADPGVVWKVQQGVLHGSEPRGTWLISEQEYGDFTLEFEWKLGERGNSGVALRAPLSGDPAFDGLELQMVDPRYYPTNMQVPASELTGSLYRAVPPHTPTLQAHRLEQIPDHLPWRLSESRPQRGNHPGCQPR